MEIILEVTCSSPKKRALDQGLAFEHNAAMNQTSQEVRIFPSRGERFSFSGGKEGLYNVYTKEIRRLGNKATLQVGR
jgi:hypothetical protein